MVKYNINTKHERDSETIFPYINPSPCNKEYWIRRAYIKQESPNGNTVKTKYLSILLNIQENPKKV
jgi:hypothetical protein